MVKSPFLDNMCTPMSTASGRAGCLCVAFDQASQLDGHRATPRWDGDCRTEMIEMIMSSQQNKHPLSGSIWFNNFETYPNRTGE